MYYIIDKNGIVVGTSNNLYKARQKANDNSIVFIDYDGNVIEVSQVLNYPYKIDFTQEQSK